MDPDDLLAPISRRLVVPLGLSVALIGLVAAVLGALSLHRVDHAPGWGITMVVVGTLLTGTGVEIIARRRERGSRLSRWGFAGTGIVFAAGAALMMVAGHNWEDGIAGMLMAAACARLALRPGRDRESAPRSGHGP